LAGGAATGNLRLRAAFAGEHELREAEFAAVEHLLALRSPAVTRHS